MSADPDFDESSEPDAPSEHLRWLEYLKQQVSKLQHGSIRVAVHEYKVLQIETNEKFRF